MISVIVPVRNEEAFIGATLERLLSQNYPPGRFEVLIVDGQSTDRTCEVVEDYVSRGENIRLLHNPQRWSSAARNVGIRASRGEIVLVVDGHCELANRQYLMNLAETFRRSGADCLGRPQPLEVSGASLLQQAIAPARSCWLGHHPDSFIYSNQERIVPARSVAVAYRRRVFEQVGLFDEAFDACEDVEFNYRVDQAGLRCVLAPCIALPYYPRSSLTALFRQLARYGRGRVRLSVKYPTTFSWKSFAPLGLVTAWGSLPLAMLPWHAAWLATVLPLVHLSLVLLVSIGICYRQRQAALFLLLPLVFLTIHLGAGWGILSELLAQSGRIMARRPLSRTSCGPSTSAPPA